MMQTNNVRKSGLPTESTSIALPSAKNLLSNVVEHLQIFESSLLDGEVSLSSNQSKTRVLSREVSHLQIE